MRQAGIRVRTPRERVRSGRPLGPLAPKRCVALGPNQSEPLRPSARAKRSPHDAAAAERLPSVGAGSSLPPRRGGEQPERSVGAVRTDWAPRPSFGIPSKYEQLFLTTFYIRSIVVMCPRLSAGHARYHGTGRFTERACDRRVPGRRRSSQGLAYIAQIQSFTVMEP